MISAKNIKSPIPTATLIVPIILDRFPVLFAKSIIPKTIPVIDVKIIIIKIGNPGMLEFPDHELKKNIIPEIKAITVIIIVM